MNRIADDFNPTDVYKLHSDNLKEISSIKAEIHHLREDILELRTDSKTLMQFMYHMQGGKAWLVGIISAAALIGSALTAFLSVNFHKI